MLRSIFPACFLLLAGIFLFFDTALAQQEMPFKVPETKKTQRSAPQEAKSEAELYLDKVFLKYDMPLLTGLKALNIGLWVRESDDPVLAAMKDMMRIDYVWEFPFIEDAAALEGSDELNKRLKEMLRDVWRDMVAGTVFGDLDRKTKTLEIVEREDGGKDTIIHLFSKEKPRGEIVIDSETGLVRSGTLLKRGLPQAWKPHYVLNKGRWRLESRGFTAPALVDGEQKEIVRTYHYSGFEQINRFMLPTEVIVKDFSGTTTFDVEFFFINREIAIRGEEGRQKVLKKIGYFEQKYKEATEFRRLVMMKKMASTGHELAAEYLLNNCLEDESMHVRAESVRVLGLMGCRNVVEALTARLLERDMEPELYIAYIVAIGNLADPAAVEALALDFCLGFERKPDVEAAGARLDALGKIRSRHAVEALIRIMNDLDAMEKDLRENDGGVEAKDGEVDAKDERLDVEDIALLKVDCFHSLEALTGEALDGIDAWNDWWGNRGDDYKLGEDG